jgi:hypothetical protein
METHFDETMMLRSLDDLAKRGYTIDFTVTDNGFLDDGKGHTFKPAEVQLDELQRFESTGNSSDSRVLYALKTNSGVKGRLVNAYSINESSNITQFMDKVK